MKKLTFFVFIVVSIISCNTKETINHKIIEEKVYDVPAKSQYLLRASVRSGMSKDSLMILCNSLFKSALEKKYKYHNPPSSISIFLYFDDATRYQENWNAMISRSDGKDEGVKIK